MTKELEFIPVVRRTVDKDVLDGLDCMDRPEDLDVITLVTGQMVDNPKRVLGDF